MHVYSDLDLTFSDGLFCPWSGHFIEVPLVEGGCDVAVSNDRKVHLHSCIHVRTCEYL